MNQNARENDSTRKAFGPLLDATPSHPNQYNIHRRFYEILGQKYLSTLQDYSNNQMG